MWKFCTACIALVIPLSILGETIVINGRQFELYGGKWYQLDAGDKFEVVKDIISVKLKPDVSVSQLNEYNSTHGVTVIDYNDFVGFHNLKIPSDSDPIEMVQKYYASGLVEIAEPNNYGKLASTPNDPLYPNQWSLYQANNCDINAPEAWDIEPGDSSVIVAIIDNGVELTHLDLEGNIWVNPLEDTNGNRIVWDTLDWDSEDNDSNGYVDDICGWSFVGDSLDPWPEPRSESHGTHVAGIVGAVINNSIGIAGVAGGWYSSCPGVKLMAVQIAGGMKGPESQNIAKGVAYASKSGTDIINISWACAYTEQLQAAIDTAYNVYGVFIVAASGNDSASVVSFPARAQYVLAVGATDSTDYRWTASNYGDSLDIVELRQLTTAIHYLKSCSLFILIQPLHLVSSTQFLRAPKSF